MPFVLVVSKTECFILAFINKNKIKRKHTKLYQCVNHGKLVDMCNSNAVMLCDWCPQMWTNHWYKIHLIKSYVNITLFELFKNCKINK